MSAFSQEEIENFSRPTFVKVSGHPTDPRYMVGTLVFDGETSPADMKASVEEMDERLRATLDGNGFKQAMTDTIYFHSPHSSRISLETGTIGPLEFMDALSPNLSEPDELAV